MAEAHHAVGILGEESGLVLSVAHLELLARLLDRTARRGAITVATARRGRDEQSCHDPPQTTNHPPAPPLARRWARPLQRSVAASVGARMATAMTCLLYTSDAADERSSV